MSEEPFAVEPELRRGIRANCRSRRCIRSTRLARPTERTARTPRATEIRRPQHERTTAARGRIIRAKPRHSRAPSSPTLPSGLSSFCVETQDRERFRGCLPFRSSPSLTSTRDHIGGVAHKGIIRTRCDYRRRRLRPRSLPEVLLVLTIGPASRAGTAQSQQRASET